MKKILNLIIRTVLCTGVVCAQSGENLSWQDLSGWNLSWENFSWENMSGTIFDQVIRFECPQNKYQLIWPSEVLFNEQASYNIKTAQDMVFLAYNKLTYKIYSWEDLLQSFTWDTFGYLFKDMGDYKIKVDIEDPNWCQYNISQNIKVYKSILLYIWYDQDSFNLWFEKIFDKRNILFKKMILDKWLSINDENFLEDLSQDIYYIKNADNIIIQWDKINFVLQNFTKIIKFYNFDFSKKQIYAVTDINENFLRRVLFRYMKSIGTTEINILNQRDLLNFITQLASDKNIWKPTFVKSFNVSLEKKSPYLIISAAVDYLIYNWIPNWIIWLILTLCVVALVISVFRQIIGLPVFSVFNPMLFAISIVILWMKFTFILFGIWFLATFLIWLINKKIYLLHSAKISMLVIVYFIMVMTFLTMETYFNRNIIDYTIFSNNYIIFPIILVMINADKVFGENINFLKKWFYISVIEFLVISLIVYFILNWSWLNYLLLSYPDFIIIIILLNLIVWRFTWLQLIEYIRFYPLMKDGEEE